MRRGISVYVGALLLLSVALSESVSLLCNRCDCEIKDGKFRVDCANKNDTETYLREMGRFQHTAYSNFNFSNNNFSKIPAGVSATGVKLLDLSHNKFVQLHDLNRFEELEELVLSYNPIEDFSNESLILPFLKTLRMSHCSLSNIDGFENSFLNELVTLDLSYNDLDSFNSSWFLNMTNLDYLDLSYNSITELDVLQFNRLRILNIEGNIMGPVFSIPNTLQELNAQNNSISDLCFNEMTDEANSSLTFLFLNQNKLTNLPNISFPALRMLDLSDNELKVVPEVLNSNNCPLLQMLILSANKFETFQFSAPLKLLSLKASKITTLRKLSQDTFKLLENYEDNCMNVSIKDNSELHTVEDSTFAHLELCSLDLSNNSLNRLPRLKTKSGDWKNVSLGINFQKNPVFCDCNSQWILDEFLSFYYENETMENLLIDLKCEDPYYLRHYRMVHWMNWTKPVFCEDEFTVVAQMTQSSALDQHFGQIFLRSNGTMMLILAICTSVLAVMFIVGLIFAKRVAVKRARRNRRF